MSHNRFPGQLLLPLSFLYRRFKVWSYVPSHSELVIRTEFDPTAPHIELLFKSVCQINLPVTMDGGLVIGIDGRPSDRMGAVTFAVGNDHFSGQVIAGYLVLRQEQRSKYSPFSLFHGYLRSEFTR